MATARFIEVSKGIFPRHMNHWVTLGLTAPKLLREHDIDAWMGDGWKSTREVLYTPPWFLYHDERLARIFVHDILDQSETAGFIIGWHRLDSGGHRISALKFPDASHIMATPMPEWLIEPVVPSMWARLLTEDL